LIGKALVVGGAVVAVAAVGPQKIESWAQDRLDSIKRPDAPALSPEWVDVNRAVDGDTLELSSGKKVRLIGIDTPETRKPSRGRLHVQPPCFTAPSGREWGQKAKAFTQSTVAGQHVKLTYDPDPVDRYGRILAYVHFGHNRDLGKALLREGLARTEWYAPDTSHRKAYERYLATSQHKKKGIWATC
jgi:micrococcal nuclease